MKIHLDRYYNLKEHYNEIVMPIEYLNKYQVRVKHVPSGEEAICYAHSLKDKILEKNFLINEVGFSHANSKSKTLAENILIYEFDMPEMEIAHLQINMVTCHAYTIAFDSDSNMNKVVFSKKVTTLRELQDIFDLFNLTINLFNVKTDR